MPMNWFEKKINNNLLKYAIDFDERNSVNSSIIFLKSCKNDLQRASEMVFQNSEISSQMVKKYLYDKKISSFPHLLKILSKLYDVGRDSPWKFQDVSEKTIVYIDTIISSLVSKRKEITFGK